MRGTNRGFAGYAVQVERNCGVGPGFGDENLRAGEGEGAWAPLAALAAFVIERGPGFAESGILRQRKNGMKSLPDYLRKAMKLVIVGCNPSESSVRVGHYYSGRNNQFWRTLYESGVIPEPLEYRDDKRLIEFGIGLTDLVKRPTRGIEELKREDFAEGRIVLSQKLEEFVPRVIAFNGKAVYEQFAQRKCHYGLQKELLYGARIFVLPSTSGQNTIATREKLQHFRKLAQLVKRTQKARDAAAVQ
jgi:double-stranded uracil-DNA glycosylase